MLITHSEYISAPIDMAAEKRKAEYLAKAKEAEEQAAKSKDEQNKASWLRIAAGYHDLIARQAPANQG